eukprot:scaffold5832_cov89-Cylindrotheca_fusiformis.AAC.1
MVFTSGTPAWSYFTADEDLPCDDYDFVSNGIRTSSLECIELDETETMFFLYESTPGDAIAMTVSLSPGSCTYCFSGYVPPILLEVGDTDANDTAIIYREEVAPVDDLPGLGNSSSPHFLSYELACPSPPCHAMLFGSIEMEIEYYTFGHATSLPICADYTLLDSTSEVLNGTGLCLDLVSDFTSLLLYEASSSFGNLTIAVDSGSCKCYDNRFVPPITLGVGDSDSDPESLDLRVEPVPLLEMIAATGDTFPPLADPTAPFLSYEVDCPSGCAARFETIYSYVGYDMEIAIFEHSYSSPPCSGYSSIFHVGEIYVWITSKCVNLPPGFHTILVRNIDIPFNASTVYELEVFISDLGFCECYDDRFDPPITLGVGDSDTIPVSLDLMVKPVPLLEMIAATGDTFPPPADPTAPFLSYEVECPSGCAAHFSTGIGYDYYDMEIAIFEHATSSPPCSGYSSIFLVGKISVYITSKCVNLPPGFHTILVRNIDPPPDNSTVYRLRVAIYNSPCGSTIAPYNCYDAGFVAQPITLEVGDTDTIPDSLDLMVKPVPLPEMIAATGDTFPPPADPTAPFLAYEVECPSGCAAQFRTDAGYDYYDMEIAIFEHATSSPPCSGYSSIFLVGKTVVNIFNECVNLPPGFHTILVRNIDPPPDNSTVYELRVEIDNSPCVSTIAPYNCYDAGFVAQPITLGVGDTDSNPDSLDSRV